MRDLRELWENMREWEGNMWELRELEEGVSGEHD